MVVQKVVWHDMVQMVLQQVSVAAVNMNARGNNYQNYQNSGDVLGAAESNNKMIDHLDCNSAARQQQERERDDSKARDELASDDQHLVGQDNILLVFFLFVVWTIVQKKKVIVLW